jgi:hypothetical protein
MDKLLTRKDLERELADARRQLEAQSEELKALRERIESVRAREFFEKFYDIVERYGFSAEEARNILASDLAQESQSEWENSQLAVSNFIATSLEELVAVACAGEMGKPALQRALKIAMSNDQKQVERNI